MLAGDKFMPEIHLRQPEFTYSAGGPPGGSNCPPPEKLFLKIPALLGLVLLKIWNMMNIKVGLLQRFINVMWWW